MKKISTALCLSLSLLTGQWSPQPASAESYQALATQNQEIKEVPTKNLGYRMIELNRSGRYRELSGINSRQEVLGQLGTSGCFEIFQAESEVVNSSFCLPIDETPYFNYGDVILTEQGGAVGSFKSSAIEERYVGFRFTPTEGLSLVNLPEGLDPSFKHLKVTGQDQDETITGTIQEDAYDLGHQIAFYQKKGGPIVTVLPPGTGQSKANGIVSGKIFGSVVIAGSEQGWIYDTNSQTTIWFDGDKSDLVRHSYITAISEDDLVLNYYNQLLTTEGSPVQVSYKVPNYNYHYPDFGGTLGLPAALSSDGYKVLIIAEGYRVQKGASISDTLDCAIEGNHLESAEVRQISKGGNVLLNTEYSRSFAFIPSETNELPNYCSNLRIKVPAANKKLFRMKWDINSGYVIAQRKAVPTNKSFNFQLNALNGQGESLANAKIYLDLKGDGQPEKLIGKTSKAGRATIAIPFPEGYQQQADGQCYTATITVKKPGYRTGHIGVLNPAGSCPRRFL